MDRTEEEIEPRGGTWGKRAEEKSQINEDGSEAHKNPTRKLETRRNEKRGREKDGGKQKLALDCIQHRKRMLE